MKMLYIAMHLHVKIFTEYKVLHLQTKSVFKDTKQWILREWEKQKSPLQESKGGRKSI